MGFRRILFVVPFLNYSKPVSKEKFFKEYSTLTSLSLSSFNHVLFELRAFNVLKMVGRGEFSINKNELKRYVFLCIDKNNEIKQLKNFKPDWWKKWGKIAEDL